MSISHSSMLSLALLVVYKTLRKLNIVLSLEEKYTARIEQTIRTTRREITQRFLQK